MSYQIPIIDKLEFVSDKSVTYILYLPENEWHELGLLFYNYVLKTYKSP